MAVRSERATVEPGVRHRVDDLLARAAEHRRHDRCARDPHQDDVVEAHLVERVLECGHALDLVRLDHPGQQVAHRQRRLALGEVPARQPVGDRE
jgi:hypothetical protein